MDRNNIIDESRQYYKAVLEYIKNEGLEVEGDFTESWILPQVGTNQSDRTLTQMDIKIKKA